MKGITPFGIYTCRPEESRAFYRSILGIERIWSMTTPAVETASGSPASHPEHRRPADTSSWKASSAEEDALDFGVVLRLESPRLELFASEVRLLDRRVNDRVRGQYQLVLYPGDLRNAARQLEEAGIEFRTDYAGRLYFEDLNGIQWEMRETPAGVGLT